MAKTLKLSQNIQNITIKGDHAQVTASGHMEMLMLDPNTKQPHKLLMDQISQDTWIKRGKGWLIQRSKTVSEKGTMDGKAMPGK